jgi:hypothetical protein
MSSEREAPSNQFGLKPKSALPAAPSLALRYCNHFWRRHQWP